MTMCVLIAVGCLTLPAQILTGHAVSWFAESSIRAGEVRYSTLLGSLTIVGVAGGLGLMLAVLLPFRIEVRVLLVGASIVGLLTSLQKAALLNLGIAIMLTLVAQRSRDYRAWLKTGAAVFAALGALAWIGLQSPKVAPYINYFRLVILGNGGGTQVLYDYSIHTSVLDRLIEYPLRMIQAYGWGSSMIGVGLKGMSGVVGLPQYPMAHNQIFDLIFAGGALYGIIGAAVIVLAALSIRQMYFRAESRGDVGVADEMRVMLAMLAYLALNLPVASGILFQPVTGGVFFVIVGTAARGVVIPGPAQDVGHA